MTDQRRERDLATAGAVRAGEVGIGAVGPDRVVQDGGIRGDDSGVVGDGDGGLGGGEPHHGHAEHHGLDEGEAEGGPPDRVEVEPPAGELGVHPRLGQVPADVHRGVVHGLGQALGPDAVHVEPDGVGEPREQVGTGDAVPPDGFVDDDGRALELAGVAVPGVEDPVLDDVDRGLAAVPHERVEMGDVDDRDVVTLRERVARGRGVAPRRVVLDEHGREIDTGPPARPVLDEVDLLRALQDDDVDLVGGRGEILRRTLHGGVGPGPCGRTPAAPRPALGQGG